MDRITCGGADAAFELSQHGLLRARLTGVISARNAGAISARLLQAAADRGAIGALAAVDRALVALAPIRAEHYDYIPPGLLDLPVAVVISPAQQPVYGAITPAAAARGAMRRAFLSCAEAEAWLLEQARSLNANRAWWSLRR